MSAQELLTTRDCTAWSCTNAATGEDGLCDEHRAVSGNGYRRGVKGARKWTPEEILDAARRWTREHGQPPSSSDWQKSADVRGGYPSYTAASQAAWDEGWGGWRGLLEAAGVLDPQPISAPGLPATSTQGEAFPEGNDGKPGAESSLVSLAEQVELARERRREAAAALRAAGEEFHRAIGALSVALEAAETEATDG